MLEDDVLATTKRTVESASRSRGRGGVKGNIRQRDGDLDHKRSDGGQVHASRHQGKSSL